MLPFASPVPQQQGTGTAKWVLVGEPVFEATVRLVADSTTAATTAANTAATATTSNTTANADTDTVSITDIAPDAASFRGAGIVVSLFYAPPDDTSSDGLGWLVTQGFQYESTTNIQYISYSVFSAAKYVILRNDIPHTET